MVELRCGADDILADFLATAEIAQHPLSIATDEDFVTFDTFYRRVVKEWKYT